MKERTKGCLHPEEIQQSNGFRQRDLLRFKVYRQRLVWWNLHSDSNSLSSVRLFMVTAFEQFDHQSDVH